MNLSELKQKSIVELQALANEMGLEGVARSRKQDIIFSILKAHAKNGESIYGVGVLEILQDGFGFLRSGALPCVPVTCWLVKSAHPKKVNVILLY